MVNPEQVFVKPYKALKKIMKKYHLQNIYSLEMIKIAMLMTNSQTKPSHIHNRLTERNSQPASEWLFHVSKCPRCLLLLARKNQKHCFGDGLKLPMLDKYEEIFKKIQMMKFRQPKANWSNLYLQRWHRMRSLPKILKYYQVKKEKEILYFEKEELISKIQDTCDTIIKKSWHKSDDGRNVQIVIDGKTLPHEEDAES